MIGIVIAMETELRPYLDGTETCTRIGGKLFYTLRVGNKKAVIVYSGIGKVNAAYATTLLCEHFAPDLIISTGVSGGLGRSKILEAVVATATVQHDADTSPLGDPVGLVSTVNKIYFETDTKTTDLFCSVLGAKKGVIACGDQFIADAEKSKRIVDLFGAIACDMESGAIGQIAYLMGTPYAVVRCISDGADENADISFETLCTKASVLLHDAVEKAVRQL